MFEAAPDSFWSRRPSMRLFMVRQMLVMPFLIAGFVFAPKLVQHLYLATTWLPIWSIETIKAAKWVIRAAIIGWIMVGAINMLKIWVTRYELTPSRFLYHHGIIVRQHDEIELHRIRDFRVIRPLMSRILGLGKIYMITRDETWPILVIGPFTDSRQLQSDIREKVEAHKRATGFREFESH